jgi:hypothetical protein
MRIRAVFSDSGPRLLFSISKASGPSRGKNAVQSGQAAFARGITFQSVAGVKVALRFPASSRQDLRRRSGVNSTRLNSFLFRSQICPPNQIILAAGGMIGDLFGYLYFGELAMVPAQPLRIHDNIEIQDEIDELHGSSIERDDFLDDDGSDDDIVSLLEENARLRKLVVRLSEIVLRNVADDKPHP